MLRAPPDLLLRTGEAKRARNGNSVAVATVQKSVANQWQISFFATDFPSLSEKLYTGKYLIYNELPTTRGTVKVVESAFGT